MVRARRSTWRRPGAEDTSKWAVWPDVKLEPQFVSMLVFLVASDS